MTEEEARQGDEGGDLDPEQVRQGREEEMNCMVKTLKMFEFGSWKDAIKSGQDAHDDEMGRSGEEGRQEEKRSSDADWWRATSNQSVKDPETTCSLRCRRWKQKKPCSHSSQGA